MFVHKVKDVWSVNFFDGLLKAIENGQSIENVLKAKNDVHFAAMRAGKDYVNVLKNIKIKKSDIQQNEKNIELFDSLKQRLDDYQTDKKDLLTEAQTIGELYDFDYILFLWGLLDGYELNGEFDEHEMHWLKREPKSAIKRMFNAKKIKRFREKLSQFMEKYTTNDLHNWIKNEKLFNLYRPEIWFKYYPEYIDSLKDAHLRDLDSNKYYLSQFEKLRVYMEQDCQKHIDSEDMVVREFAAQITNDILTPKKLKVSDWVERLDNMSDDELIMFDISTQAPFEGDNDWQRQSRAKVANILKYNCIKGSVSAETKDWFCDKGYDTAFIGVELFSPVMRADDAKKIIPKLLSDLSDADMASNLVVAIRPDEMLHRATGKNNVQKSMPDIIMNALKNKEIKSYDLQNEHDWNGIGPYKDREYLFSGGMISDDYKFLSRRQGRCGISYAAASSRFAFQYAALTSVLTVDPGYDNSIQRTSATTDTYVEPCQLSWNGRPIHIGFINVYKKNPEDKYYGSFGLEHALCERKILGVGAAPAMNLGGSFAETFVTPEKNPLVDKIMCLAWNKRCFCIPMQQDFSPEVKSAIQSILDVSRGCIETTLRKDQAKRLYRFNAQLNEFEKGIVHENDTLALQDMRREKLKKIKFSTLNNAMATQRTE